MFSGKFLANGGSGLSGHARGRVLDPAWPAGLWWSPPPESNRRPHPYHSCGPPPIEEWAQDNVTRVTVSDRQAPSESAPYGTEMARHEGPSPMARKAISGQLTVVLEAATELR